MDQQRKTIQSLTVTLDSKREELTSFYRQFGEKMIQDSRDSDSGAGAVPADRVSSWKALMASRENDTRMILDIKSAVVRQQELHKFRKEIDASVADEKSARRVQLERLGSALYRNFDSERDGSSFGKFHEDASCQENILIQYEEKQDRLKHELLDAGFFGKMFAQFRMASLATNIRQHRSRLNSIFSDGARRLVDSGEIARRAEAGLSSPEQDASYTRIVEIGERLSEIAHRVETLDADQTAVAETFSACGATGNPPRRLDELRGRIKETDKRIDTLTVLSAREYSDKFLDEDGRSVLGGVGDGNTFSDMGAYAHQLEQVAQRRSAISVIKKRIDLLETSLRIESLDRNIAGYERSIADSERKIEHYRALSEKLRKNIVDTGEDRERLVQLREALMRSLDGKIDENQPRE
jgi:hypothetical protein